MKLSRINYGTLLHSLAKISFKSGEYGCAFVNGCGLVTETPKLSLKFGKFINFIMFV